MKIGQSSFITSAVDEAGYPADDMLEIAFAGRSNVGKSSLLNMLLNRKKLAKTSSTPGKTQTINFFNVDDVFRIVDLPGYGFARVSKSEKIRWGQYIEDYLNYRENLIAVFLLVDIRHEPNEHDIMMFDYIKAAGFRGAVIATKLDKIKNSELMQKKNTIRRILAMDENDILLTVSNSNRKGKYKTWDYINSLLTANNLPPFERQNAEKHWLSRSSGPRKKSKKRR